MCVIFFKRGHEPLTHPSPVYDEYHENIIFLKKAFNEQTRPKDISAMAVGIHGNQLPALNHAGSSGAGLSRVDTAC